MEAIGMRKFQFAHIDTSAGEQTRNALFGSRGRNLVLVMARAENEPKGEDTAASKVCKVLFENFLRRASLKDEAIEHLNAFMNDSILSMQSPQYKVVCSSSALIVCGERFRFFAHGSIKAYHFINGQVVDAFPAQPTPKLGEGLSSAVTASPEIAFTRGEHSFLLAGEDVARLISDEELEQTLARATSAAHWIDLVQSLFQQRCKEGDRFNACTLLMPSKKERPSMKKTVVIALAVLVALLLAFFGMGALRRSSGPQPEAGGNNALQMQAPQPPQQPPAR